MQADARAPKSAISDKSGEVVRPCERLCSMSGIDTLAGYCRESSLSSQMAGGSSPTSIEARLVAAIRLAAEAGIFQVEVPTTRHSGDRHSPENGDLKPMLNTPLLGVKAPAFELIGTDGKTYRLADVRGERGTVVVFICNHCPYVKAVAPRMVADARILATEGIGFVAISSNDAASHPQDSFDNMKAFANHYGFPFPYLHDESQAVARAYDAVCTPDFFGLNSDDSIEYRGRLDEGRKDPPPSDAKRELIDAMRLIAETGKGPEQQLPSVGCSIKWKAG